jgi:hypothetical protein
VITRVKSKFEIPEQIDTKNETRRYKEQERQRHTKGTIAFLRMN